MGTKEESCGRTDVDRGGQRNRTGEGMSGGFNATGPKQSLGRELRRMGCNLGGGLKSHGIGYGLFLMPRSKVY
jgi:hypothetical protein